MSTISLTLKYRDPLAAIDFLTRAFGFERHAVHEGEDGSIQHAELRYGDSYVMFAAQDSGGEAWSIEPGSGSAYVAVEDPDALHARAKAAGAEIVYGLRDQDYGSREFAARDPEGNLWFFGTYVPG